MNAHFRIGRKYNFGKGATPFFYSNDVSDFTYTGFSKGGRSGGHYNFKDKDGDKQIVSKGSLKILDMLKHKVEVK